MPHSISIANHHKKSHLDTAEINMEHLQTNNNNNHSGAGGIFNNVENLSRGGGGEGAVNSNNSNGDGNGAPHGKESTEQSIHYYNIETLAGQSLRDINGGADDNNSMNGVGGSSTTSDLHGKSNFAPPPIPPPRTSNPPTPSPVAVYIPSLRNAHKSSSNNGNPSQVHTAVHSKYSMEQNAQNPDEKPKGWIIAPEPEPEGEEDETTQIERVQGANPTYDTTHNNSNNELSCKSNTNNGQFFNGQTTRNGGVVLRYQYELVQHIGEGSLTLEPPGMEVRGQALEYNVLPRLEGSVSDLLIPVFFEECRDNNEVLRERRGLGVVVVDEVEDWENAVHVHVSSRGQGLRQQHYRRLNKVVGIDAKPDDFALTQAGKYLVHKS